MLRTLFLAVVVLIAAQGVAAAEPPDLASDAPIHGQIAALIDASAALTLPARVDRALTLTLRGAQDALQEGQVSIALTFLRTFTFEVRGVKRAKRLRADAADALLARAAEAMGTLDTLHTRRQTPAKPCDDASSACSP